MLIKIQQNTKTKKLFTASWSSTQNFWEKTSPGFSTSVHLRTLLNLKKCSSLFILFFSGKRSLVMNLFLCRKINGSSWRYPVPQIVRCPKRKMYLNCLRSVVRNRSVFDFEYWFQMKKELLIQVFILKQPLQNKFLKVE